MTRKGKYFRLPVAAILAGLSGQIPLFFTLSATMKLLVFALACFATVTVEDKTELDCIPDGDTMPIPFDSPDLKASGMPVGAEICRVRGREDDPFFDDELGDATLTGNTYSIPIENKGGTLSGPSGEGQNGGNEGDCIEVYLRFTIRYPKKLPDIALTPGGVGIVIPGDSVWVSFHQDSDTKEVCPCPE